MNETVQLLGWSGVHLELGEVHGGEWRWQKLELDWQPGDIRNCSYGAIPKTIGITAADRTVGKKVLAVYDPRTQTSQFLLRSDRLLHHSLNRAGTAVCFTSQSDTPQTADLELFDMNDQTTKILAEGQAHPRTTPAWIPEHAQVVYEAADGQLELLDIEHDRRESLTEGQAPTVSSDGQVIAFSRSNNLFVWDRSRRIAELLLPSSAWGGAALRNGLSWSAGGKYLSFGVTSGLVGKETTFYLLDVEQRTHQPLEAKYFRGLLIRNA